MDISGFDEYVVERICIFDEYDQHSKCTVDVMVDNDELQKFMSDNVVGSKEICASIDDEIVFYGTIRNIKYSSTYLGTKVHVEANSFTDILDSEIHNRVFQNPNKTYSQINSFFSNKKVEISCVEESLDNEKVTGILIQHNETDYEFLKRIYSQRNVHLYVNDRKRTVCSVEIGEKRRTNRNSLDSTDIVKIERTLFENYEEIEVCSEKIFEVGSELDVFGNNYIIISRNIESKYEKAEATYKLIGENREIKNNCVGTTYSLGLAKVVDNASEDYLGRIQVEFIDYENEMCDEKIWIDYLSALTEKGGGIVTIPDIDEIVEVIFRNGECIAIGCVRKTELDELVQDISKRYVLSRNCNITIDEKNINVDVDKNKINITDEMVEISNEQFEIIIKEEQCKIGFGDSRIVLEKDRIQSIGKSKIEIQAGNIEVEGKSSVKVKTKSFDVG